MIWHAPVEIPLDAPHSTALAAAITFRECSLRRETSSVTRRACRTLMRELAMRWRNSGLAAGASTRR